ncbi:MAG: glutamate-5-semialdehyde dehydrogenase, partial [Oscillospiraceae bacterium]
MKELVKKGEMAKAASRKLSVLGTDIKNEALGKMAKALLDESEYILAQNKIDLDIGVKNGMSAGLLDRLTLTEKRLFDMAEGIRQIQALPDPIGEMITQIKRPNGLKIGKVRVPLGVIGIIYEARPNVTADAAALCLKSGNTVILRGGKEAFNSNMAVVKVMQTAVLEAGLPTGCINIVENTTRESSTALMRLNDYLDVIIPRGGRGLIKAVVENATVPTIETGTGNCHVYVDKSASFDMAKDIIINAKTQRPSVCNAEEKLLVHQEVANDFLPIILDALMAKGVSIIGDETVCGLCPSATPATPEDWDTEYLDLKIGIRVVKDVNEAIEHINRFGSGHSEAIITNDYANSQKFLDEVDAAAVYVNASTRFTDGFEFGFGAEIGISTQKIHARGPMGLSELTTTKYII